MTKHTIRSYVKRSGRLSKGQQRAITELLPKYQITEAFLKPPLHIEIGFGDGKSLIHEAKLNTNDNFLGFEVHSPGVGHLLLEIEKLKLNNIRVLQGDFLDYLPTIQQNSVARVMLFFPDPWHKKKHHKRRIIRPDFIAQIVRILQPSGVFHMATDWQDYAEYAVDIINQDDFLQNMSKTNDFILRPKNRLLTKFEQRGKRLGHQVWDMMWQKRKG